MADLYSQLGQSMSSAIEYGGKGNRFWQLGQIEQLYDQKRKRLNRLMNNLGYGVEAVSRFSDIHKRNNRLEAIAKARGYEIDTGFLGLGEPKFYRPAEELDSMSSPSTSLKPREEVSIFDMFGLDTDQKELYDMMWGE